MSDLAATSKPVDPEHWARYMPRPPVATSDRMCWHNLIARRYHHVPAAVSAPPLSHHLITFYLNGPSRVQLRLNGEELCRGTVVPGKILIMSSGQDNCWDWDGNPDVLHVYLSPDYVAGLALEIGICDFQLANGVEIHDPILFDLGKQIMAELDDPVYDCELIGDALAQLIAVRLVRAHSCFRMRKADTTATLPTWRLKRVLSAIEDHLDERISLDELADVAGLSKFHFARSFKAATGVPPHRYILGQRLRRAKSLLRTSKLSISEVALAAGFASQEHLTTSFRKQLGTTPGRYRQTVLS